MEEEIWKTIDDFDNYEVSNFGRVRNKTTGLIRVQGIGKKNNSYYHVDLYKNDGKHHGYTKSVHVLVAETFMGKHPGMVPDHKDGNRKNNKLDNLEWVTQGENQRRAYELGLREPPGEKKVKIVETGEIFKSITECANAIDANVQNVSACLNGKRHQCNSLHFEFADDENNNENTNATSFLYDYQFDAVMKLKNGIAVFFSK